MKKIKILMVSTTSLILGGCSQHYQHHKYYKIKKYKHFSIYNKSNLKKTKQYTVRGKKYKPYIPKVGEIEIGTASWYGKPFHGRKTASGEVYNMNNYSAAHKYYPINTVVKVTNLKDNKSIVLRINDRGPYNYNRVIDLSKAAAKKINLYKKGTGKVKIEVLGYATR